VKLTVDCVLNHELANLESGSALSRLIAIAEVTPIVMPLEALICKQFGVKEVDDFPIAAISAAIDGLNVGDAYWLRADPVHLAIQRDCFSLSDPVPLMLETEHARLILDSLNQHFNQDGLMFYIGKSGAWYVRADKAPQLQTILPSVAMDKNVHQFMPQGENAPKWKAILNEIQMLLHDHPVNEIRESNGNVILNSIWLSGGGMMPLFNNILYDVDLVISNEVLNQGLAKWANKPLQTLPNSLDKVFQSNRQHVRLKLTHTGQSDATWFEPILSGLRKRKIEQLTLNLGFYERTFVVVIKPLDICKFWRKSKTMMSFLK
jgi:hypothetical protein